MPYDTKISLSVIREQSTSRMRPPLIVLRAIAEVTRLRILSVLRNSELTVSELMEILEQSQPRVSRHLKLLCDAGLLQRYQEGSRVFHRIVDSGEMADFISGVLDLTDMQDMQDIDLVRDQQRLQQIKNRNAAMAAAYFRQNAAEWDTIRTLAVPESYVEKKLIDCLDVECPDLFLDLGTGTGRILEIFSPYIKKGIGIDMTREMLMLARSNLDSAGARNCSVRHQDIGNLSLEDNSVDAITIHQVLHYLDRPDKVIREAARVLRTHGQLIIVDFLPHELEFLREKHAHRRLGISPQWILQWAGYCGLSLISSEQLSSTGADKHDLSVGLWNLRKTSVQSGET